MGRYDVRPVRKPAGVVPARLACANVRTLVVVPTYNEADNIVPFLTAVRAAAPDVEVLVVDDNSPDGTGRLADETAVALGNISVLHRTGKAGLGAAYRHGFEVAFERGHDVIVSMDSDLSHDPAVIPTMIGLVQQGADAVVGSRYVPGGGTVHWPLRRRLLSKWGNRYTGFVLGLRVRDCTSGFRAYRASALRAAQPGETSAEGYAFLTELVRRLARSGARVVETPILFRDRERGVSKMSGRIIVESMWLVTRWGLRDLVARVRR
ncbi:MAG: polyprenol-phosphate mannosyltransferase [Actinomycetota bacterium]